MNTLFLGKDEVRGYLRDLLQRLESYEPKPEIWCPVTQSGTVLLKEMLGLIKHEFPQWAERVQVISIEVADGAAGRDIRFDDENPAATMKDRGVLLFDGAVHSGTMMSDCAKAVLALGPSTLISYSLVIKRGSRFIPTLWGVMMDETDRAFFLLNKIPNHRLNAGGNRPPPAVHLERLDERHLEQPPVQTGVGSMDRVRWSERFFQMQATDGAACTYVLMKATQIVGYLTLHGFEPGGLMVDEVAVGSDVKGGGYGGILMRFADSMARQGDCRLVRLFGIAEKVDFYRHLGYYESPGRSTIRLDKEVYQPMERTVLYHQNSAR